MAEIGNHNENKTWPMVNTHLVCAHRHLHVLTRDLEVPDVFDIVPGQFEYICGYVLQHSHNVQSDLHGTNTMK